ncbi:RNA polymerase sigma factor [Fulvivirga sediminis]|uniref:Sigma-70 family RNA polymerase sigma factor n=1 Tax=Fulvivirga sediminis TaxID=2803949 RepID=A0A937F4C2_9BACT|nr:sigma-70 family RNA polymerase sigma factor [Fulvivirga sediminis]MBL3654766.1 sigma-70 family RNA polymerase sigma factor [Fulvivirga sediminis]
MEAEHQTIHIYLIKRCQKGDRQAQTELYKLYVAAMYNICRRMMGEEEEAKDVLQDAFITAFSSIHTLKKEVTFGAWLKRIVINHCLNALKKRKLLVSELNDDVEVAEYHEEENEYCALESHKILQAIDHISEGCRTVMNLYLFEGYDHKEIGQILGITESASKAQYSKAKSKVRKILNLNT